MSAKAKAEKVEKQQVDVLMVGNSRGAPDGERVPVDPERAASLVARGLARYPDSE